MFSSNAPIQNANDITRLVNAIDANQLNELGAWQSWNEETLNAILTHRLNDLTPETLNNCISNCLEDITVRSLNNILYYSASNLTRENLQHITFHRFSDIGLGTLTNALKKIKLTPNDITAISSFKDEIKKIIFDKMSNILIELNIETLNAYCEQLILWENKLGNFMNEQHSKHDSLIYDFYHYNDDLKLQQFIINLISKTVRKESSRLNKNIIADVIQRYKERLQPSALSALRGTPSPYNEYNLAKIKHYNKLIMVHKEPAFMHDEGYEEKKEYDPADRARPG